jgi:hypothetical protein
MAYCKIFVWCIRARKARRSTRHATYSQYKIVSYKRKSPTEVVRCLLAMLTTIF